MDYANQTPVSTQPQRAIPRDQIVDLIQEMCGWSVVKPIKIPN